jgi:hypothetical protein
MSDTTSRGTAERMRDGRIQSAPGVIILSLARLASLPGW